MRISLLLFFKNWYRSWPQRRSVTCPPVLQTACGRTRMKSCHSIASLAIPTASLKRIILPPPNPRRPRFDPRVRKIPWRREWQPTLVFWPGEFHGQRSLAGYSPRDGKESDTTE